MFSLKLHFSCSIPVYSLTDVENNQHGVGWGGVGGVVHYIF